MALLKKQRMAGLLTCAMIASNMSGVMAEVTESNGELIGKEYVSEANEQLTMDDLYDGTMRTTSSQVEVTTGPQLDVTVGTQSKVLNASEMDIVDPVPAETQIGIYTITGGTKVTANGKKSDEGDDFTKRLQLNGKGSATERSVHFKTNGKATLTIYAMSGTSTEERTLNLCDESGTVIGSIKTLGKVDNDIINKQTIEIDKAGSYYLACENKGINIYKLALEETPSYKEMTLSADSLEAKSIADSLVAGDFKLLGAVDVDASVQTATDGEAFKQRIKLNGSGSSTSRSIHFTMADKGSVEIYAISGSSTADRKLNLYKSNGDVVGEIPAFKDRIEKGTIQIQEAGDYYIASPSSGVNVYKVVAIEGEKPAEVVRPDWDTVAAPVITSVDYKEGTTDTIEIKFDLETSIETADKATVIVKDAEDNVVEEIVVGKSASKEKTATFKPSASGTYSFQVLGQRNGVEEVKESNIKDFVFSLPLTKAEVSASNKGGGSVLLKWTNVKEAEKYRVEYKKVDDTEYVQGAEVVATETLESMIADLEIDTRYNFRVVAVRGNDESISAALDFKVMDRIEREWAATYFGQSSSKDLNKAIVVDQENLTVQLESCSINNDGTINKKGGKFTTFHDGITYYYTEIDAAKENFELTATFTVDYINPTADGQEGFGIIAMDSLGEHGVSATNHYTNSASIIATKYDHKENGVTLGSYKDIMGTRMVSGITPEVLNGGDSAIAQAGKSVSQGYNYNNESLIKAGDKYTLTLKKTNTGYHMIMNNDPSTERIMYGVDKLLQLDNEKVYVGLAAARGCNVTVTDIQMKISDPTTDAPAVPEPEQFDLLTTKIDSPNYTGDSEYTFAYRANLPGTLNVKDESGKVFIENVKIEKDTDFTQTITLAPGTNKFKVAFKPDEDSRTANGLRIESYEETVTSHNVVLQAYEGTAIYVSPNGTAGGKGTADSPVDVQTATRFVKPGQEILLASGTYNMKAPLTIQRGIDGTADANIIMRTADGGRAIFDFENAGGGMQLWGSYWHITGIDVCNTPGNVKGLQVAGHYNTIERVEAYNNGDTGIQISGTGNEGKDKWPSNNLILNCSSYDNIDPGENNADGFAAKITCGEGNIFRGCAAYNNLDDGWDLFSKIESGPIGAVIIEDCIAFNNGTLSNGHGNGDGNGFKLGGDGIAVSHILRNSISFNNNANGITSNSDPAVEIYNNTAFGNKGANINLYGKGTGDRAFVAENNISMAGGSADIYELKTLETENNYFFDGGISKNSLNQQLKNDIFESVDVTSYKVVRKADGSIDMGDLLKLNSKAPAGIGANLSGETIEKPQTNRTWNFGKDAFAEKLIQGTSETIEGVVIDATATGGKFNTQKRTNAQINPGTLVKIPVSGPTEFTFKHGYDKGTLVFTDEAGNVEKYTYTNDSIWKTPSIVLTKATEGYVTLSWEAGSSFYLETLTTKEAVAAGTTLEVGPTATYKTVQSALNAIDYTPTEDTRVIIAIAPGVYEEEVTVTKPYITFKNADPLKGEVKITYDKASGHDSDPTKNKGTQDSASVTIAATAKGFEAYDITFENSYNLNQDKLGDIASDRKQTQAVAVVTFADQIIFENCNFIGRQDTLYLKGSSKGQSVADANEARVYLKDCYVEGTVDFIFGDSTAVFENCKIHMAYYTNGGHYTAPNTTLSNIGYVFDGCEFTISKEYEEYIDAATGKFKLDEKGNPVKNIDLGRPWQADHTYPNYGSQSVMINCKMDNAIAVDGWKAWDSNTVTNKVRFMEYNSMDLTGKSLDLSSRLDWVRRLGAEQAAAFNTVNVLRGSDNWNPSNGDLSQAIEVADVTLDQYRIELPAGETVSFKAKVLPVITTSQAITWKSSDEAIATVDANGKVTAVSSGKANITATTEENGCSVSAEITVTTARTEVPNVKEIKVEANETILPGDVLKGSYTYEKESDNQNDNAKVQWFIVDPATGEEMLVQEGTEEFDKEYRVASGDIGYQIKFAVIPESKTTYGNKGQVVKSEPTTVVTQPDYKVPELYVRESFTNFGDKYEDVTDLNKTFDKKWVGTNLAKAGETVKTALTLLHTGAAVSSGKAAWKVVDTSGKAEGDAEFNGNATVASNIEYQNDASILVYNADKVWTNYTAQARMRFSPLATGYSSASYLDMYIDYSVTTNSGYKVRLARGGNTNSVVVTLYKVEKGTETQLAQDSSTLANKLKQNAGEENPFFRVEMSNNVGEITAKVYIEGAEAEGVTLTYTDQTPLSGTVAFENFGKSGCPIMDMLTVEEIIKESAGGGAGPGPSEEDKEKPVLVYDGETTINVAYGAEFKLPEVTATDNVDKDIVVSHVIKNSKGEKVEEIYTKVAGTYTITYAAKDEAGNEAILEIKVVVAEEEVKPEEDKEKPVFVYEGEKAITVAYGAEFTLPEVTATDNVDKDVVVSRVIKNSKGEEVEEIDTKVAGTYTITYVAKDEAGNEATLEIKVVVAEEVKPETPEEDKEKPVFSYQGEKTINVVYGAEFKLPEVTATDNVDKDVVVSHVIKNSKGIIVKAIDTKVAGTYTITYTAKDKAGNEVTLEIKVVVAAYVSDDDYTPSTPSNPSSGTTGATDTTTPSADESILQNVESGKAPNVELDKDHKVEVKAETLDKLIDAGLGLVVKGQGVEVSLNSHFLNSAQVIGTAKPVQVAVAPVAEKVAKAVEAQIKSDTKLQMIGDSSMILDLSVKAEEALTSFNEPLALSFDLSKVKVEDASKLTLVSYETQKDGSIKVVKLGGKYDPVTKTFSALTGKPGQFGVVVAEDLVKVNLTIGSVEAEVNDKVGTQDVAPQIIEGKTMMPLRFIAESLNAEVKWDAKLKQVIIASEGKTITLQVGKDEEYGAVIKDNRTLVPIRYISEQLDAHVLWVPSDKAIEIVK